MRTLLFPKVTLETLLVNRPGANSHFRFGGRPTSGPKKRPSEYSHFRFIGHTASGPKNRPSGPTSPPQTMSSPNSRLQRRRSTVDGASVYPYRCCCKKCHPVLAVIGVCLAEVSIFSIFLLASIIGTHYHLEKIGSNLAVLISVFLLFFFGLAIVLVLYGFWRTKPKYLYFHMILQILWIMCLLGICVFLATILYKDDKSISTGNKKRNYNETITLIVLCSIFSVAQVWWILVIWRSGVSYLRFKERADDEIRREQTY